MNEATLLISGITSCVWAVIILVACMYLRMKKIVDNNRTEVYDISNNIHREISELQRVLDTRTDDIYRTIDSRLDKLANSLNSKAKSLD